MAYTDIVNVDYSGRGNTSTGAANSTTGSGGELVDQAGGRVSIASGRLSIPQRNLEWLSGNVFPSGSPTYELNQIVEADVPAGLVQGDTVSLYVRNNVLPSWGSERGCYGITFMLSASFPTGNTFFYAISNANRSEDHGAGGFAWFSGGDAWTYDSAKPYRFQLKIEQSGGVDTLTASVFDMSTGTPVLVKSKGTTVGAGGAYWSGTDFAYLANAGRCGIGSSGNPGFNNPPNTLNATKISRLRMATEPAIPPLSAGTVTLVSQTAGTNIVNAPTAGGDGSAITRAMYSSLAANFTPGAGNLLGATDGSGNRTHAHGDAPAALPLGGAEIRSYKGAATQSGTTVFSSSSLLVQSVAPALPAPSILSGLLGSQKLVVVACGDSNTGGPDINGTTIGTRATQCYNDLRDVFGIPNGNIIRRQTSAQGSMLLRDWLSGSAVYNVSEGTNAGGNGMPNGSPNLLNVAYNVAAAAEAANPGALVVLHFSLGTNDLQSWSAGTPSTAQLMAGLDDIVNFIRVTKGKANWNIVFHGIPFGTAGTINVPDKINAYLDWRRAMLAKSWPAGVYLGAMSEWMGVYNTPSRLADGIHYTTAGAQWAGSEHAKGLAYSALYDPPTAPPSGTPTLAISYVAGVLRLTRGGTITGTAISYRLERIVGGSATTLTTTMGTTYDDTGYTGASGQSYRVTPYNSVGDGTSATASASGETGDGEMLEADDTEVVATSGTWSAGIAGPISIDLQPLEGDLYYQIGTSAPAAGAKGKFIRNNNAHKVRVTSGKTIYWRSKDAAGTLAYDIKNS